VVPVVEAGAATGAATSLVSVMWFHPLKSLIILFVMVSSFFYRLVELFIWHNL
jgi:hypothetical protein